MVDSCAVDPSGLVIFLATRLRSATNKELKKNMTFASLYSSFKMSKNMAHDRIFWTQLRLESTNERSQNHIFHQQMSFSLSHAHQQHSSKFNH